MATVPPPLPERDASYSPDPLRRKTNSPYFLDSRDAYLKSPQPQYYSVSSPISSSDDSTAVSSPIISSPFHSSRSLYSPNPPSITLPPTPEEPEDDDILLPSYDTAYCAKQEDEETLQPSISSPAPSPPPTVDDSKHDLSMPRIAGDDSLIHDEPTRHVDYLSHDWEEEDIWSSWRYVVSRRNAYSNSMRLENASWRTWAKAKYKLGTVTPESLNWLKDCDVTWLYGPLQTASKRTPSNSSPPPTRLSTSSSFLHKKPILKRRTASQAILQRSIVTRTLLSHAGAILKAQAADNRGDRPRLGRSSSDYPLPGSEPEGVSVNWIETVSTGTESPNERRHISFNDEVSQCIAVEGRDDYYYDDIDDTCAIDDDQSSVDSVLMMREMPYRSSLSNETTPRSSFSSDSKTIAPLPPTTLKYGRDTPEPEITTPVRSNPYSWWPLPVPRLSHTPSTETLRPPKQPSYDNFLLDDDGATVTSDVDAKWQSPRKGSEDTPAYNGTWFSDPKGQRKDDQGSYFSQRRFLSFDYDDIHSDEHDRYEDDEENANFGLLGKVVDTVNTARDIAHVIWNVGWRN
ncbi:hypothetical protein FQN50_001694 [Emmonsiellopsis sp. PD_5]|nr:hypothetical protein FQN50_001694 [Emmonsiellopsis sp. PD_5]